MNNATEPKVDDLVRTTFQNDASLREEFLTLEAFDAYVRADLAGRVRRLGDEGRDPIGAKLKAIKASITARKVEGYVQLA